MLHLLSSLNHLGRLLLRLFDITGARVRIQPLKGVVQQMLDALPGLMEKIMVVFWVAVQFLVGNLEQINELRCAPECIDQIASAMETSHRFVDKFFHKVHLNELFAAIQHCRHLRASSLNTLGVRLQELDTFLIRGNVVQVETSLGPDLWQVLGEKFNSSSQNDTRSGFFLVFC